MGMNLWKGHLFTVPNPTVNKLEYLAQYLLGIQNMGKHRMDSFPMLHNSQVLTHKDQATPLKDACLVCCGNNAETVPTSDTNPKS